MNPDQSLRAFLAKYDPAIAKICLREAAPPPTRGDGIFPTEARTASIAEAPHRLSPLTWSRTDDP